MRLLPHRPTATRRRANDWENTVERRQRNNLRLFIEAIATLAHSGQLPMHRAALALRYNGASLEVARRVLLGVEQ